MRSPSNGADGRATGNGPKLANFSHESFRKCLVRLGAPSGEAPLPRIGGALRAAFREKDRSATNKQGIDDVTHGLKNTIKCIGGTWM